MIFLTLFVVLTITLFWGYNNHLKIKDLINTNQELMRILREGTAAGSSGYIKEGRSISDFIIRTIDNQNVVISSNSHAILLFIDTACKACVYFLTDFYKIVKDYKKENLTIIALSVENEGSLREFREKITLPIYFAQDTFSKLHRYFRINGSPSMVYIKNGVVKIIADQFNYEKRIPELINLLKDSKIE